MTGRAGRAAILAVASVVLGIAAHGESGADGWAFAASPATASLIAAIAVATGLVALQPPSLPRVGLLLSGAQLALHVALGMGMRMENSAMMADAAMPMSMPMSGPPVIDPRMIVAHVLVTALVTAGVVGADRALLAAGQRGAAVIVAVIARTVRLGRSVPPIRRLLVGRPRPVPARRPTAVLITRSHPRRGPPALVA